MDNCKTRQLNPCFTGRRHVEADVQGWCETPSAILSVKSALSVVQNRIAFLPRIPRIIRMNHRDHKNVIRGLKESFFSSFCSIRDGETETQTWRYQFTCRSGNWRHESLVKLIRDRS